MMAVRRAILLTGLMILAPGIASAETPMDFLQSLIGPPARAVTEAFRPAKRVAPPKEVMPKANPATELLAVPMPRLRPGTTAPAVGNSALGYAPPAARAAAPLVPEPQIRPTAMPPSLALPLPAPAPVPPPAPRPVIASLAPLPPVSNLIRPPPAANSICGVALARLAVEMSPLAPISEGSCGIDAPVAVSGLEGGQVDFTTKAILSCDLAEAVAGFVASTVQPAAIRNFGNRVTGIRIAASYACRTRDHIKNAKLSEHAFGNAVDISAFKVNCRWIDVKTSWGSIDSDGLFLKEVRGAACGPFKTVLGPGSDSFHSDHFHLDMAKRRTAGPSRGLFCQ
jgi:hypothetical protein